MLLKKIPLAWLQLVCNKKRFFVALAGIAFADLLIFMQTGFQLAMYYSQAEMHRRLKADLVIISAKTVSLQAMASFSWHRLYQAHSIEGVESVKPLYVSTINDWRDPETGRNRIMLVIGIDPEQPTLDVPELAQYRETLKLPDVFLFDQVSRGDFVPKTAAKIRRGDLVTTEAGSRKINLVGLFTFGAMPVSDGTLITSDLNFLRLFRHRKLEQIDVGLISLEMGKDPQKIIKNLQEILPNDVKVLTKNDYLEFEKNYIMNSTDIGTIFTIGIIMGAIIGSVIMYQILYAEINDYLAEYATLKAMGYHNSSLIIIVGQQALILAILGYIPGFVLAIGFYELTSSIVKVPIFMTLSSAIFVFALSVLICCLSAIISSRQLRLADPAEIFDN